MLNIVSTWYHNYSTLALLILSWCPRKNQGANQNVTCTKKYPAKNITGTTSTHRNTIANKVADISNFIASPRYALFKICCENLARWSRNKIRANHACGTKHTKAPSSTERAEPKPNTTQSTNDTHALTRNCINKRRLAPCKPCWFFTCHLLSLAQIIN